MDQIMLPPPQFSIGIKIILQDTLGKYPHNKNLNKLWIQTYVDVSYLSNAYKWRNIQTVYVFNLCFIDLASDNYIRWTK